MFQRHAALLVASNAACLISGSGFQIWRHSKNETSLHTELPVPWNKLERTGPSGSHRAAHFHYKASGRWFERATQGLVHEDKQKWEKVESLGLAIPFPCHRTERLNVHVEKREKRGWYIRFEGCSVFESLNCIKPKPMGRRKKSNSRHRSYKYKDKHYATRLITPAHLSRAPLINNTSWNGREALWGIHSITSSWYGNCGILWRTWEEIRQFQKGMLLPWRSANSNWTAEFQSHWDVRLEAVAKGRDKAIRKWTSSKQDCTELCSTFHALDKQIKRSVRNMKSVIRGQELNAVYRSQCRKRINGLRSICGEKSQQLCSHFKEDHHEIWRTSRGTWRQYEKTSREYRRGRFLHRLTFAHTFSDKFRTLPTEAQPAKSWCIMRCLKLVQILKRSFPWHCGIPGVHWPIDRWNGTWVDLCHFRRTAIQGNHRPIWILSATRKTAERIIPSAMKESFQPHRAQMSFPNHRGTEMALAQMHRAANQTQNWIAILDRMSAYDRLYRLTLMSDSKKSFQNG